MEPQKDSISDTEDFSEGDSRKQELRDKAQEFLEEIQLEKNKESIDEFVEINLEENKNVVINVDTLEQKPLDTNKQTSTTTKNVSKKKVENPFEDWYKEDLEENLKKYQVYLMHRMPKDLLARLAHFYQAYKKDKSPKPKRKRVKR